MGAVKPFQRFLDEQRDVVWRYLLAAVGRDDADDLFQETFMAAMRAYPRAPIANERAWVLTIAQRKATDHFRARARRAVPLGELPETPATDGRPVLEEPTWAAVRDLPPKQRAAVTLRFAGDLRHGEIAAALGISEDAARRNVHEGLKALRAKGVAA